MTDLSILEAVILGIIQGLTEFLPVSSSGHLQLLHALFGVEEPTLMFDVWLHVATLIPVCIVFRKTVAGLVRNPFQKTTLYLVIGTVPAVLAALVFGNRVDALFSGGSVTFLIFTFTITGAVLLFADWVAAKGKGGGGAKTTESMTWVDALIIGCAQALAIPPGISRSGSTIAASLQRGINREEAAKFVFLLSVPAILGATVLEIVKIVRMPADEPVAAFGAAVMLAGFAAAAMAGYLAIQFFLALIKKARLRYFSVYVFVLAALIAVDAFLLKGAVLG
jgi:undecaprenyl-diphosphatase